MTKIAERIRLIIVPRSAGKRLIEPSLSSCQLISSLSKWPEKNPIHAEARKSERRLMLPPRRIWKRKAQAEAMVRPRKKP